MKSSLVLPCLRGVVGDWVYYSSTMTAKQIAEWVVPAKNIREAKSLDEHLQRDLQDRKKKIAQYLLENESRFFNSIVVGVYDGLPDWIQFDISKKLDELDSSSRSGYIEDSMGLLSFKGDEKMFAIDGQHRVAGIEIAIEKDEAAAKEDQVLTDDRFPVIFLAHIDTESGRKRTRILFSDINKNAKPVAKGDRIKIDEKDLVAVVTRRVYAEYQHFDKGLKIALTENQSLDKGDEKHFVNLYGLYSTHQKLRRLFKKSKGTRDWDEDNILKFKEIAFSFYDLTFNKIQEYRSFFIERTLSLSEARKNNQYLLFRPIGLVLVARLYVHFFDRLDFLYESLNKISLKFPDSPLNNIVWNNGKMEAKSANQNLAFDLMLYILKDYPEEKIPDLQRRYRDVMKNSNASLPKTIDAK